MRTLTRPRRQVIFTLAIVAATMAPTAFVARTAWQVNRAAHRAEVADELARQLDLRVELDGVRYPRPGVVVFDGPVLHQPEPRRNTLVEVARAERLTLTRMGRRLVLRAEGLSLRAEGPRQAMEQVGRLLSRAGDGRWDAVALSAPGCAVRLGDGLTYELLDLGGSFRLDDGAPTIEAGFRLDAGPESPNRCVLTLVRDRRDEGLVTTLTLRHDDGLPLPAGVLAPFFDADDWLGPGAMVQGELALVRRDAGPWEADFSGELIDVDLAGLGSKCVPYYPLSGRARLRIDSAHWGRREASAGADVGWVRFAGALTAEEGVIGEGLLASMASEDLLVLPGSGVSRASAGGAREFARLGVGFDMDERGTLRLEGALNKAFGDGSILLDRQLEAIAQAPPAELPADARGLRRALRSPDQRAAMMVSDDPKLRPLGYLPSPSGAAEGR